MILETIDWAIIVSFLLLSLFIGLRYRAQAGKSLTDFFLGGRKLPWYIAGVSMVATTFAADTPLAVTELVAKNGISGNWLWWNFLAGGMLTTFFFARLWRRSGVLTEVELIELRYSGKPAALLRGFKSIYLGLAMNVLIIGWVNLALGTLLQVFFGIPDHELIWYIGGAMLIAASYSALSGLMGVAITDVIQFFIAIIGTVILAIVVVNSEQIGGLEGLKQQLTEKSPWALDFFPRIDSNSDSIGSSLAIGVGAFFAYASVQWWASWYPGAEPGGGGYIAQRMMSTKDEKHSLWATLFFQVAHYCIRPWPWILVGLAAIVLYPDLAEEDLKMGYVLAMKDFLPAGLKGLLLVAFLAAYLSTISTQLNWGASYLVNDFYKRFIDREASNKVLILVSRITTVIIMVLALVATTMMDSISGVWTVIIECGAGLGLVLILRWYWWRINAWSEMAATITPFVVYMIIHFFPVWFLGATGENASLLSFPESFLVIVGCTTAVWLIVTFITPPTDHQTLLRFYTKVLPDGWWGPMDNEGIRGLKRLGPLLVCWLSGIVGVYAVLFAIGKLLFAEWVSAGIWICASIAGFVLLSIFIRKTDIENG